MQTSRHFSATRPNVRFGARLLTILLLAMLHGASAIWAFLPSISLPYGLPLLWPEDQRAFLQDGPGLLLAKDQVEEFVDLDVIARERWILEYLQQDPLPVTEANELVDGITRRRALAMRHFPSFLDDRAKVFFLRGAPAWRDIIDCAEVYRPLEIWTYGESGVLPASMVKDPKKLAGRHLVFYRPEPEQPWKLWVPIDSKRKLYNEEMEYWLEQYEELRRYIRGGRRFDRQICDDARTVDNVTGIDGLFGFRNERPKNAEIQAWLQPPDDLAAWAAAAAESTDQGRMAAPPPPAVILEAEDEVPIVDASTPPGRLPAPPGTRPPGALNSPPSAMTQKAQINHPSPKTSLDATQPSSEEDWTPPQDPTLGAGLEVFFPEKTGQRMVTRMMVVLPPELGLKSVAESVPGVEEEKRELRLTVEGLFERDGKYFDDLRVRFQIPVAPEEEEEGRIFPVALVTDQALRPGEEFLLRLKVTDEIGDAEMYFNHGFKVPGRITDGPDLPALPEEAIVALGEQLMQTRTEGHDSLILIPPESDIVFGLWRAEALVTGTAIRKVKFYLDDQIVMSRRRPPFTAELRLATYPTEQVVRAEGLGEDDEVVAFDEVILNQPRGALRVRIIDPQRGRKVAGEVKASAEVVVPEEQKVEEVQFLVNGDLQATLDRPPWTTDISVPITTSSNALTYLTVTARLDNGLTAEDVRFLNAPEDLDEVDVNLVELYTTVTDKGGRLVRGLTKEEFEVREDKRPQEIVKFELVEDLPLTLGIVVDTSGSMFESLGEAQRAAAGFLENIVTPKDRCFAVAFADAPALLMPRTSDVGAVTASIEDLIANGATSLHDAIVTSLYYYRGTRGRRALVVLSDGEDTSSSLGFKEALEYAKRSGVAIYTIGLKIGRVDVGVRRKLEDLAQATGGRTFFIKEAAELFSVYGDIEAELRSQYLVAYNSDQNSPEGTWHEIEIEARGGKLKARTMRGYYE